MISLIESPQEEEQMDKATLIKKLNEAYEEMELMIQELSFYKLQDKIISEKCDDLYFKSLEIDKNEKEKDII